jgi:hypothetical protein
MAAGHVAVAKAKRTRSPHANHSTALGRRWVRDGYQPQCTQARGLLVAEWLSSARTNSVARVCLRCSSILRSITFRSWRIEFSETSISRNKGLSIRPLSGGEAVVEHQVSNLAFNSSVAAGDQTDVCGVAEIMLRCSTAPSSQHSREILWTVASRVARRSTMRSQ